MSMSEYENQNHKEWDNLFPSTIEPGLPADFSEEDVAFAQELGTLFSAPDEILPPYYAQTLLQAEDPRYSVVDHAFAQKTRARVFRALKLRRRLFFRRPSPFAVVGDTLREIVVRKSLLAGAAALMLVMMLTAAFTAPSFGQGMSLLLHGSRNGVLKVKSAPKVAHQSFSPLDNYDINPKQVPLVTARNMLNFDIYWPQWIPANYTLDGVNIYIDSNNTWADGPILDLVYDLDTLHAAPKGTGQIVVREFMPQPIEQVLQVVQDGNAYGIEPDQYGDNPRAIYVDGQWLPTGKMLSSPVWRTGGRSEVIYQQGGVVFWIAGDQRDGVSEKTLWKMAQSLNIIPPTDRALQKNAFATILLPTSSVLINSPFSNDIISTVSLDGTGSQYYLTMSEYLSGKLALSHGPGHGH